MASGRKESRNDRLQTETPTLFELPEKATEEPRVNRLRHPVWTENKARLIELYLYYFVLITKHGTYIDGFAGPQRPRNPEMWAAKLVLESEPKRLRHFYLFDIFKPQVRLLNKLKRSQPRDKGRSIRVFHGDFNIEVLRLLRRKEIKQTEATFCLIDQRTFECHWQTLVELAKYKEPSRSKVELYYFLAVRWLRRALSAIRYNRQLEQWWGRSDWATLKRMTPE